MNLATPLKYQRTDRISQLIKKELSDIILRKVADPRLNSITITGVDVTKDFMTATVKLCRMMRNPDQEPGAEDKKEVLAALKSARSFIFQHLKKRLEIRYVPNLVFEYDFSLAESSRMWAQIKTLSKSSSQNLEGASNA